MDEARRRLREEATQNAEMLGIAETLARLQLTDFLRKAGFQEIEITFRP
jgi:N-acetylglutamate synthase-like GNAT family acetyltransferase